MELKRICLVSPGHPANNPRLVRNANALCSAGHEVVVVSPRFDPRWASLEEGIVSKARWTYVPVDMLRTASGRRLWRLARFRRRICFFFAKRTHSTWFDERAVPYGFTALAQAARLVNADLYLAQQHSALPIALKAIRGRNIPIAMDAEDLLAEQPSPEAPISARIEQRFLRRCSFVLTMSVTASEHLAAKNGLSEPPLVLHNVPALSERIGIQPPLNRIPKPFPTVYWFGQTIGAASRLEQIVRAMPLVKSHFRLVLRGNPIGDYVNSLRELARGLGCAERVEVLPVADPAEMVKLAAEHDVLFGSQPGQSLYNQCAIGNKVMTGILAGLAILFSDTVAHRRLLAQFPGLGECVPDQDEQDVARVLNHWFSPTMPVRAVLQRCWDVAGERLNWDYESKLLTAKVAAVLEAKSGK